MFSTRPAARSSSGGVSWTSASGATVLTARTAWRSSVRSRASGGSGLGPRSLALLTSRSSAGPVASARAAPGPGGGGGGAPRPGAAAGDGGDRAGRGEAGDGGGEPVGVPAVDDQP